MASAVDSTALNDDESTSTTLKRRRSSSINQNEIDIEQTPFKRIRSLSSTNNSTSDNNNNIQSILSSLNDIVQSHRNLVHEYTNLQLYNHIDRSSDEQNFIQSEEELIEKVEKNLHDINHIPSTPPSRNGKRQRYQSINSTNQSFDRIKHETHILKRIEELKSDGKWTNQRLAKCLEPNKRKTHWDYLLDEMRWLAEDFLLEKRWKQAIAKKLSHAVLKYFQDKNQLKTNQQHEQMKYSRKQTQFICKEVMNFWKNIHQIAKYKQSTRLEELNKYQLDSNSINTSSDIDNNNDDEETIEREEENLPDEYDLNELKELEADQNESIDIVLKHHYGIDLSNSINDFIYEKNSTDNDTSDEESIFNENHFLTTSIDLIENNIITSKKQLNNLSEKVQLFQPTGITLNTTSIHIPVPFLLKYQLREYQHVGLNWLGTLYENKFNCILADEKYLGKTIQTIALLAHLACEKGVWGPHLIIVPTNLMLNWELEFKKWCPALKILIYYGTNKERQLKRHQYWSKMNSFHICITSTKYLIQDKKYFHEKNWIYLILDNRENIKEYQKDFWQILFDIHSKYHLLLINTLLPNIFNNLWLIIKFIIPNLSISLKEFHQWFSNSLNENNEQELIEIKYLQQILQPFILRRFKFDIKQQLLKQFEYIIKCHLSKKQQQLYNDYLHCKSIQNLIQQNDYMTLIHILMKLKTICNHPNLFEKKSIFLPYILEKNFIEYHIPKLFNEIFFKNPYLNLNYSFNDIFLSFHIQFTLQPTKQMIIDRINFNQKQTKNYSFHQSNIQLTKDIIEQYRNTSIWSQNLENNSEINQIDFDDEDEFQSETIYHEICEQREKERLLRSKFLYEINSERCQTHPLYGLDILFQIESIMEPCKDFNRTRFNGYTLCQKCHTIENDFIITNTLKKLIKTNQDKYNEYQENFFHFFLCTTRVLASPISFYQSNKLIKQKPFIEILSSIDFDKISLLNLNQYLQFPEEKFLQYNCNKLQILDQILFDFKHLKSRCLIYTHMIKMLDILELFLNSHNYTYLRLDHTMNHISKQILIEHFNHNKKIFIFILSTRIENIDLNIMDIDRIIFYDTDWNPRINNQIQDQYYRFRQRKDIHIYHLINENTIEEKLLKKNLHGNFILNINSLKKDNIQQLFNQISMIEDNTNDQEQLNSNDLVMKQFEEALVLVEDEIDRQIIEEEINDLNENQIEEDSNTIDQQLRPIERYALRRIQTCPTEHQINLTSSNTYLNTEQIQKDWQLSRLQILKEQEEKQMEQDNDEMMYTYPRENERKIWITEDGQAFEIWCGIIMKYSGEENEEIYNDDELDFGYESEAMIIEPEEYIRYSLPKALVDTTNTSKSDTNILVPRSLFDRSNLLLNTQSSSLSTNTLNKSKQISNNNNNNNTKIFPATISTPQANIKARQLYVNNGTTTTPLPNSSNTNVIVSASTTTSSRPIKLEEMLSKDNFQGLLEIDNSDWLISEDYKVLDTIQNIQQLPLSSMSFSSTSNANKPQSIIPNTSLSTSPLLPSTTITTTPSSPSTSIVNNTTNALTQNWDFISDIVNRNSRILRTPKQCKHRFEQVIGPREEGRVVYDLIKKKKHVIKGTVKMPDDNWQMLRTNQLFVHDNCQKLLQIYQQKFDTISQFEQQISSMIYLNKFKQMQIAQATHHQMRGFKQGSLLQENNIHFDVPLTPSDVSYQRSEREKELKQQQQSQATQSVPTNLHPQQQQTSTTPNNIDTIKSQISTTNTALTTTTNSRVRPTTLNTTSTSTPINPSPSTPLSLIPACSPSTPTIQRSISNNIIVASNNHSNMHPTRSQSNTLSTRTNLPSSTQTSINSISSASSSSSPNQSSLPTATIVPGQRQVQVLPSNETNSIQQKPVGTVQISSNDYRHVRTLPHQQQTTTTTPPPANTNPSPTPTNLQVRTQNYQRNQAQAAALATLEVRSQLPPSPKSQPQSQQQQQQVRPSSTTPRTQSVTQTPVDYLIQSQTKSLPSSTPQSSLPVAVVRPMQHSSTSISPTVSSSPTSPLNLASLNVTLPPNKLTTTTGTGTTNLTTNNSTQQLRTATTFLSNQGQTTSQPQQIQPQLRQIFTNANNNSQTSNAQRLAEVAQRSPSNIQQIIASRTTALPGQVRNVRILTFTPGTNPPTGITDTTTTTSGNTQQTPIQSANITYNRSNSGTSTFSRSTINIEQDVSPDIAAQLHRLKSFNVTNTDPNDPIQTPRAVLVPARTISGSSTSSTSSVGSTSKMKSSSLIDPTTLGFTAKTSQANIVFQLPSSTSTISGGDEQTLTTNSSNLTRQNLMQHFNLISSNLQQRSQSPTTATNSSNSISVNRFFQQYQIRAALNNSSTSTTQISSSSSGQINNEQIASSSPPPPPPSSSSSSSTT